jgi:hypothetical protein
MKVYGSYCMCDLFSLNYRGPSMNTTKRENKKGVRFVPREYVEVFKNVANIYKDVLRAHNITGPVPMILFED